MQGQPRILIADDDRALLTAITARMRAAGFEVRVAEDCYQAVQVANRWQPDVVVLDVRMPAGDGFSVQDRIASIRSGRMRRTPIIFLTGERSARIEAMASSGKAFAVLHKPCRSEELIDTVEAALRESRDKIVIG